MTDWTKEMSKASQDAEDAETGNEENLLLTSTGARTVEGHAMWTGASVPVSSTYIIQDPRRRPLSTRAIPTGGNDDPDEPFMQYGYTSSILYDDPETIKDAPTLSGEKSSKATGLCDFGNGTVESSAGSAGTRVETGKARGEVRGSGDKWAGTESLKAL